MKFCRRCHKKFLPYDDKQIYCSFNCYSPPKQKQSEPYSRKKMKELTKERDLYSCQLKGTKHICEGRLESHHIIYLSQSGPDEAWNLVTLCTKAHRLAHSNSRYWQPRLLGLVNGDDWYETIDKTNLSPRVQQILYKCNQNYEPYGQIKPLVL